MKSLVTLQIIVETTDSQEVEQQLYDWFMGSNVGMVFHIIHTDKINFLDHFED